MAHLDNRSRPGQYDNALPTGPASFEVSESVIADPAFPVAGSTLTAALNHAGSLWGKTAKLQVQLPSGHQTAYFLKVISLGEQGRSMCEGEFESLKAIHTVSPTLVPEPHAWGTFQQDDQAVYFLLMDFRDISAQPADPVNLGKRLADLHHRSQSPTGKFGFHCRTTHARIAQAIDEWDDSWCRVFSRHLRHFVDLAKPVLKWPEFDVVGKLVLEKVVPQLLLPLQEGGRVLKPCLVHGDCWDGNTAVDAATGEAFVFDACSFYGHNEYDIGNWRAPRHQLSDEAYVWNYTQHFPVSEPAEDWDARNLLYSLTFNIGNAIYIPGSQQREKVYEDMTTLCKTFCRSELEAEMGRLQHTT